MEHIILADESKVLETRTKVMDWTEELTDLFGCTNTEAIQQPIQDQV
jgi:hypothetical protein